MEPQGNGFEKPSARFKNAEEAEQAALESLGLKENWFNHVIEVGLADSKELRKLPITEIEALCRLLDEKVSEARAWHERFEAHPKEAGNEHYLEWVYLKHRAYLFWILLNERRGAASDALSWIVGGPLLRTAGEAKDPYQDPHQSPNENRNRWLYDRWMQLHGESDYTRDGALSVLKMELALKIEKYGWGSVKFDRISGILSEQKKKHEGGDY